MKRNNTMPLLAKKCNLRRVKSPVIGDFPKQLDKIGINK